jgi:hypothetical protein
MNMYGMYSEMKMLIVDSVGWDSDRSEVSIQICRCYRSVGSLRTMPVPETGLAFHPFFTEIKPEPPNTTQPSVMPFMQIAHELSCLSSAFKLYDN